MTENLHPIRYLSEAKIADHWRDIWRGVASVDWAAPGGGIQLVDAVENYVSDILRAERERPKD